MVISLINNIYLYTLILLSLIPYFLIKIVHLKRVLYVYKHWIIILLKISSLQSLLYYPLFFYQSTFIFNCLCLVCLAYKQPRRSYYSCLSTFFSAIAMVFYHMTLPRARSLERYRSRRILCRGLTNDQLQEDFTIESVISYGLIFKIILIGFLNRL